MADGLCDVCGVRPATVRAQVVSNGQRQNMELCEVDYRRLARQQRPSSPLESLFGGRGSLFDDVFGGDFFGESPLNSARQRADEVPDTGDAGGTPIPVRSGRGRARGRGAAAGVADRLSGHAEEILQAAAQRAGDFGRREVDT